MTIYTTYAHDAFGDGSYSGTCHIDVFTPIDAQFDQTSGNLMAQVATTNMAPTPYDMPYYGREFTYEASGENTVKITATSGTSVPIWCIDRGFVSPPSPSKNIKLSSNIQQISGQVGMAAGTGLLASQIAGKTTGVLSSTALRTSLSNIISSPLTKTPPGAIGATALMAGVIGYQIYQNFKTRDSSNTASKEGKVQSKLVYVTTYNKKPNTFSGNTKPSEQLKEIISNGQTNTNSTKLLQQLEEYDTLNELERSLNTETGYGFTLPNGETITLSNTENRKGLNETTKPIIDQILNKLDKNSENAFKSKDKNKTDRDNCIDSSDWIDIIDTILEAIQLYVKTTKEEKMKEIDQCCKDYTEIYTKIKDEIKIISEEIKKLEKLYILDNDLTIEDINP